MSDIKLGIINVALANAGELRVSSLTEDDDALQACKDCYDQIVEEELETGVWKFALKTTAATHLTAEAEQPLFEQWTIPEESIKVLSVLYNGNVLTGEFYEINGRTVRTIYDTLITITYVYLVKDEFWPTRFKSIISRRLEAVVLRATERRVDADNLDDNTRVQTVIAKHAEASQRPNRPTNDGSIVERRRNRVGRR